jgi:hypothetical protein
LCKICSRIEITIPRKKTQNSSAFDFSRSKKEYTNTSCTIYAFLLSIWISTIWGSVKKQNTPDNILDINDRVLTGVFCFLTLPQIVDIQILNKKAYIVQLVFVYSFLLLEKSNADEFCVFFLGIVISIREQILHKN